MKPSTLSNILIRFQYILAGPTPLTDFPILTGIARVEILNTVDPFPISRCAISKKNKIKDDSPDKPRLSLESFMSLGIALLVTIHCQLESSHAIFIFIPPRGIKVVVLSHVHWKIFGLRPRFQAGQLRIDMTFKLTVRVRRLVFGRSKTSKTSETSVHVHVETGGWELSSKDLKETTCIAIFGIHNATIDVVGRWYTSGIPRLRCRERAGNVGQLDHATHSHAPLLFLMTRGDKKSQHGGS